MLGDELRALRVLKRAAKSAFNFVSESGVFVSPSLASASRIERAGIASAAIELHRRQLASSTRCGRQLGQTDTPLWSCRTLRPGGPDGRSRAKKADRARRHRVGCD